MRDLLLVMSGGAAGAALRYSVGLWAFRALREDFPWGTLIVNLGGGLLMGLLAGVFSRTGLSGPAFLLLGTGLLGGFTTFSAFSLEVAAMLERGQIGSAAAYVTASVAGSVLLLCAGLWAGRMAV